MKNVLLIAILAVSALTISCNQTIEWTPEMEAQFTKQCLDDMATRFKAEDPDAFCDCFVGKMKEEEMGMMDLMKNAASMATACGANLQ